MTFLIVKGKNTDWVAIHGILRVLLVLLQNKRDGHDDDCEKGNLRIVAKRKGPVNMNSNK